MRSNYLREYSICVCVSDICFPRRLTRRMIALPVLLIACVVLRASVYSLLTGNQCCSTHNVNYTI